MSGDVSFFVVPIVQQPSGTFLGNLLTVAAPALLGAVAGGGLTLCVARKSFRWAADAEAERREEERLVYGAEYAYSGYVKLSQWVNLLANQKEMIKEAYDLAEKSDLITQEPCDVVPAFVGRFVEPDFLKPHEYSFLQKRDGEGVIAKLHLVEQRASNNVSLLQLYSQLAIEFERWREGVSMQRAVSGDRVTDAIPSNLEGVELVKRAKMNRVFGNIQKNLSDELAVGDQVVQEFIDSAHHHFGERFPHRAFGPTKQ